MSSRHSSFHACVVPALIHSCAGLVNTTGREVELTCRLNLDSRELHLKYLLRVLVPHRETTDSRGSRQGTPPVSCFIRYLRPWSPWLESRRRRGTERNKTEQNEEHTENTRGERNRGGGTSRLLVPLLTTRGRNPHGNPPD